MDKNTIIAIVIIFFIVLAFQFLYVRPRVQQRNEEAKQVIFEEKEREEEEKRIEEEMKIEEEKKREEAGTKKQEIILSDEEAEEKIISIDTSNYSIEISSAGASVISFKLKNYLDRNGAPIELVEYSEQDILPFEVHFDRLRNVSFGDRTLYHV